MNYFIKKLEYSKVPKQAAQLEYELQTYISNKYNLTPKTFGITWMSTYVEFSMERVQGQTLADRFGDDPSDIPEKVWKEIRRIITLLYTQEGIEYIDITPYNFMIDSDDKVWIIDFGHAYYCDSSKPINWFLEEFIYSEINSFNPDFA